MVARTEAPGAPRFLYDLGRRRLQQVRILPLTQKHLISPSFVRRRLAHHVLSVMPTLPEQRLDVQQTICCLPESSRIPAA